MLYTKEGRDAGVWRRTGTIELIKSAAAAAAAVAAVAAAAAATF